MPAIEDYLFSAGKLWDEIDSRRGTIKPKVDALPEAHILGTPPDAVVAAIADELEFDPLTIFEEHITVERGETRIDVSNSFDYGFMPGAKVDAMQLTVSRFRTRATRTFGACRETSLALVSGQR